MIRTFTITLVASLACAGLTYAQPEPDVIVSGERLREATFEFADTISAPLMADDQIGRWTTRVCVGVAGMRHPQSEALIDRISYRALQVGLSVGGADCEPNVLVFYTADSDTFTRQLFARDRSLFAYFYEENINTQGQAKLQAFLDSPRPIRAWHVVRRVEAAGFGLGSDTTVPRPSAGGRADGLSNAQVVRSQGTRLRQTIRQDFLRVVVIIDGRRTQGHTLDAVSDYAAMITLAQLNPNADTSGRQTILNLFTETPAPGELTNWDIAYLQGIYTMTQEASSARQQVDEISATMERGLSQTTN